jgi:hypothetical protein
MTLRQKIVILAALDFAWANCNDLNRARATGEDTDEIIGEGITIDGIAEAVPRSTRMRYWCPARWSSTGW